jgi:Mrp family chromosome partitioning ATPase/uncharacterized protein involved in exopolysaccharide biosynthesis
MRQPYFSERTAAAPRPLPADPLPDGGAPGGPDAPGLTLARLIDVLRRRFRLVAACVALALLGVLALGLLRPSSYRATAVLRMVGERALLTGETEGASASRTVDPLLSSIQVLRSRSVVGEVVDSLGLRLQVARPSSRLPAGLAPMGGIASLSDFDGVRVEAEAAPDTLRLRFERDSLVLESAPEPVAAAYGQPLRFDGASFTVPRRPAADRATLVIVARDEAIDLVLAQLTVAPRAATNVVDVRYTSSEPEVARRVVNHLVQIFREADVRLAQDEARRRREFLAEQLRKVDDELDEAQDKLAAFRSEHELASASERLTSEQAAAIALDLQRGQLEAEYRVFQGLLGRLQRAGDAGAGALQLPGYSPEIGADPALGRLYQQLLVYRARLDSLTSGPWRREGNNPDVIQLRSLVGSTAAELTAAVRGRVISIGQRREALDAVRGRQTRSLRALPALQAQEMRLDRQVQALGRLSERLREDHEQARLAEAVEIGSMAVMDLAPVPYRPVGAPLWVLLAAGALLGLMLGVGGAFLLESRDSSFHLPEQIEGALQVPGLGVIPRIAAVNARGPVRAMLPPRGGGTPGGKGREQPDGALVAVTQPMSAGSEAFRMLRMTVAWSAEVGNLRSLVITSALPGEGKTLTAANLAATFARDGAKVLLVDADLRRPRQHAIFGLPRSPGLAERLRGELAPAAPHEGYTFMPQASRDDPLRPAGAAAQPTLVENLYLLTAGTPPKGVEPVVQGALAREILQAASHHFDLVIVDAPPILATADALVLAAQADGVVFVVRAGDTDRRAAELGYEQIRRAGGRVVGAILNDPRGTVPQYGEYYQYPQYTVAAAD